VAYTRKGDTLYAVYLAGADEKAPPAVVQMPAVRPVDGSEVRLLGCHEACPWTLSAEGLRVELPTAAREKPPCEHAWVFQVRGEMRGIK
jgi:alpha-L-fucosidase